MTALAEFAMLSHGWRQALLLLCAGALAALSAAPLFLLVALMAAMPVLVWALDGAERRKGVLGRLLGPAFRIGFFFGLGYFGVSLHWIGAAFFVDGGWPLLIMPLALAALAAVLALFWGAGTALAHLVWSAGAGRIFALAGALGLAEFARGHLFTGFPFNLLGYALTANLEMMQAASLVGTYGLTFAAVLVAAAPALVWPAAGRTLIARLVPLFAAIGLVALQLGWGHARLGGTAIVPRTDMVMRVVQPAVPQDLKWQTFAREEIVERLIELSTMHTDPEDQGLADVTHLVWPEAALPFFLSEEPQHLARIARMLPEDTLLLTGAPREAYGTDGMVVPGARPFNSIFAFNAAGEAISSYDKTQLVPFGEYLPFQDQLARFGLGQFVPGAAGWAAGDARRLMDLPGTPPFLPLICYEAVYPGGLGAVIAEAGFILVLTNDAWFDGTIGPAQHFHHARIRSVEHGLAMVRAANSGISAIIDPMGRIDAMIAAGAVGAIKGAPALPIGGTMFVRLGHLPFFAFCALGLALGLATRLAERRGRRLG